MSFVDEVSNKTALCIAARWPRDGELNSSSQTAHVFDRSPRFGREGLALAGELQMLGLTPRTRRYPHPSHSSLRGP